MKTKTIWKIVTLTEKNNKKYFNELISILFNNKNVIKQ
jgi:hypothetical protein